MPFTEFHSKRYYSACASRSKSMELHIGRWVSEAAGVAPFVAAVLGYGLSAGQGIEGALGAIKMLFGQHPAAGSDARLQARIQARLQGLQASARPDTAQDFPQRRET